MPYRKGHKHSAEDIAKACLKRYPPEERADRFWALVNRVDAACWEWLGTRTSKGYGLVNTPAGVRGAHRVALMLTGVAIPDGWEVDHKCFNPPCVRPDHLQVVPSGFNSQQAGNRRREKTHCPRGHPYSGENLVLTSSGGRACRECVRMMSRASYARMRQKSQEKT